ncbi:argininosuccinate synthase [Stella humosa]|uniref:argininosuccinate synthase n=1 Tax=Stella humosa TaxID=94 RepID=A0A3N1LJ80_9PROT|nr:argininosuccinate synthase [Stella humosa]ROP91144.1 argininosuccinate synthase [Stella humosa]BBK34504.1 argininosuccinate synthase [Stella humosa]
MNVADLKGKTIALLASGGLDTCTVTYWLKEHDVEVVCFTADLGQPDETDFGAIETRMRACGAADFVGVDLQRHVADLGLEGIQAQSCYESRYWNVTGFGRQATTAGILPEVKKKGLTVLAHGATGRGNDQVRFQLISNMLDPSIEVYAPWRDQEFLNRFRGRSQMIDYCEQHGLPIKASRDKPYSTDANLLGLTHEAGRLESLETPAQFVTPEMGVWAKDAPDVGEDFTVRFEKGMPVQVNGKAVDTLGAFLEANAIAGRHGVGIGLHMVENRFVGVKSRGVYEQPGIELLGTCYGFLIQLVLDRRSRELFDSLSDLFAKQVYQGYYNDLASRMIRTAVGEVSQLMTGTIKVHVYKGQVSYAGSVDSPHSLYSLDSSMEAEGSFDHRDSEGFLRVLAVHAKALSRVGQV